MQVGFPRRTTAGPRRPPDVGHTDVMATEVEGPGAMPVSAFDADGAASIAPDANLLEVARGLLGVCAAELE